MNLKGGELCGDSCPTPKWRALLAILFFVVVMGGGGGGGGGVSLANNCRHFMSKMAATCLFALLDVISKLFVFGYFQISYITLLPVSCPNKDMVFVQCMITKMATKMAANGN